MYKFDVTYNLEDYNDYYKFVLIKQRVIRDLVFSAFFLAVAVYFFIHNYQILHASTSTAEEIESVNTFLPWLAITFAVLFPCMNFLTLPMIKKQLKGKKEQIEATHLDITFNEDEVVYVNLNAKKEEVKEEIKEETPVVEEKVEEPVQDETPAEETENEEKPAEEEKVEEKPAEEEKKDDSVFNLQYSNFMQVIETQNQFLFYLDKSTVIILPKKTSSFGDDFKEFKEFILTKINKKRVRFMKEKKVVEE